MWCETLSAPDDLLRINPMTAFATDRVSHRDVALLTERAGICVQEELHLPSHFRTACRTSLVLQLEIPNAVALRTVVVRYDLDIAIDHVLVRSRITERLIGRLAVRG